MILFACVDGRMGMAFNRRRQSRDRAVCEDMLGEAAGGELFLTSASAKLFDGLEGANLRSCEDPAAQAGPGQGCFLEDPGLFPPPEAVEKIILYRWNRTYPFDRSFPISLPGEGWRLERSEEFPGTSHEKITKEVYAPWAE